jgi:hypothetical protein
MLISGGTADVEDLLVMALDALEAGNRPSE